MIIRTDNPFSDLHRYEDEQAEYESKCPICAVCGERITDETFRRIDGECYHDACIETVDTDLYVEGYV